MQINRLFEIVHLLLNKKTLTAKELAEHFEVSRRTILRDVDVLSQAGVPIYTSQGKGGGISILDNYVLNKTAISDEEQSQILFALQSLSSAGQLDADDILPKLRAFFDKTETNWIEVDFSRWGNTTADHQKFERLKASILKRQAITFSYPSAYGELSRRTVYPLKLVFKAKAWYLEAYCLLKQDYRVFKINRMLSLETGGEVFPEGQFTPPPRELNEPLAESTVRIVLRFSPQAVYRVFDEFDETDIVKNEDGSFNVTVDFPDDHWLYGFLLSFGASVQVLEPESVRTRLLAKVEEIKSSYR